MREHQKRALFFFPLSFSKFALRIFDFNTENATYRARSHTHARTSRYPFEKFGNIFRRVIDAWVQNARSIRRKKRVTATYFENTQISNFARIYFFIPLFKKTNKKKFCDEG